MFWQSLTLLRICNNAITILVHMYDVGWNHTTRTQKVCQGPPKLKISTLTHLSGHCNLGLRVVSCKMILPYHSKLFSKWQNSLILEVDKKKKTFVSF
jgi:hypothetical protein